MIVKLKIGMGKAGLGSVHDLDLLDWCFSLAGLHQICESEFIYDASQSRVRLGMS